VSSSASFTPRELEQLRNSVYKGYQYKPRNYGEEARAYEEYMSDDNAGDEPVFRNEIDFSRYDGSRTGTENLGKPGHDGDENTSRLWNRVRKEIGIKDVDSENDLRQMFDFVRGYKSESAEAPPAEPEAAPEPVVDTRTTKPDQLNEDQKNYQDTRLTNPENNMPRMGINESSDYFKTPGTSTSLNPYKDAINHGNDLNDYYQNKFIPSLQAEAQLTGREIGESTRFNIADFVGKIPELGDPREMFGYYRDELDAYM